MQAVKSNRLSRKILFWAGMVVVLLAAFVGGMWYYVFDHYVHPQRMELEGDPSDFGLEFDNYSFKTFDGLTLNAWLILPPEPFRQEKMPLVVTVHGYGTNRWDIMERNASFARKGYLVFTYDQRACGSSDGNAVTGGAYETADLKAAIDKALSLEEASPKNLIVYGFSMGAAVAIMHSSEDPRVCAVIADSPFMGMWEISGEILTDNMLPQWPFQDLLNISFQNSFQFDMKNVSAFNMVKNLSPVPLLLLTGTSDETVPTSHVEKIFEAAGENKMILRSPGLGHRDNGSASIFENTIHPFLVKHLGPPFDLAAEFRQRQLENQ